MKTKMGIATSLAAHHQHCDALFESALDAAHAGDWAGFRDLFSAFCSDMEIHFEFEEQQLFPAFEESSGITEGPTRVMRDEHEHMRQIMHMLGSAHCEHDPDGCLAEIDNLAMTLQQHNAREEGMLYPACEQMLGGTLDDAAAQLLRSGARELDVRDLQPPEPFVRIMQCLSENPAQKLRVRIHREPLPLYEVLQEQGFRYRSSVLDDGSVEILIDRA